jgi:cysteine-rich repeat protein
MGSGRSPGPDPGEAARSSAGRPPDAATSESVSSPGPEGDRPQPGRWRRPAALAAGAIVVVGLALWLGGRGSPPAAGVKRWLGVGAVCGNGQLESGEECDDGNTSATDRCLPSCKLASCGDGQIRTRVEECDDGNQVDGDGCSKSCLTCPAGSDSFSSPHTGHCYWRQPDSLSFADAAANCARDGGNLVTFGDDDEWREVTERLLAGGNSPPMWIGLRREERNGLREFGWVTGERVLSAHWGIQEPRRSPANLDCGLQGEAGAWATSACDEPHSFVCERPGWSVFPRDGHAYRRFVERVQWEEAQAACAARGGHLVSFADEGEQTFVTGAFQGAYWIGAVYDPDKKTWGWNTNQPLSHVDWAPGEPNLLRNQHCVAVDVDRRWYNRECDDRHGFVCEVE